MGKDNKPILIVAGGTGGHVMPALAVAEYLLEKGTPVHWLGTRQGIESQLIPKKAIPIDYISISGLRGKSIFQKSLFPFKVLWSCFQVMQVLMKVKPKMVLAMGGYVTVPVGLMAWLFRIPLAIHEQNAIAGWANQLLSRFAKKVMLAYPDSLLKLKEGAILTGNPLRQSFTQLRQNDFVSKKTLNASNRINLLIVGGSQGAEKLNQILPKMVSLLDNKTCYDILHQTGERHFLSTQSVYEQLNIKVTLRPFVDDMAAAYLWADIVVCRAGALTVAEVSQLGKACILIPFPYAVDNHQLFNAKYLTDQGGALLLTEDELTPSKLLEAVLTLSDEAKRAQISKIAKSLAKPLATVKVASECLSLIDNP